MNQSDVNPQVLGSRLQEARKLAGLTQAEVAERLDMARTTVTAIEKGERPVRPRELVALASLYSRSVNELLRSTPPVVPLTVQLRAVRASDSEDELDRVVADFQILCDRYAELESMLKAPMTRRYPTAYPQSHGRPEQLAEDAAVAERHRLALGDGPLLGLRSLLENDVGVRIFYLQSFPAKVAGMFAFNDCLGACIGVNYHHPHERRRMTVAHEYGHLVFDRHKAEVLTIGGVHRTPRSEKLADAFARCFLMPSSGLRRRFNEIKASRNGKANAADICLVAEQYKVSFEAMCRRLEELGLVRDSTYDNLKARGFKPSEAKKVLGLQLESVPPQPLPDRYRILAVEAFQSAMITESQLAAYLKTDRLGARAVVREHSRWASLDESGEKQLFDLSLSDLVS